SRRRHTRSKRDWSSDVCSSDLSMRVLPSRPPVRSYRSTWSRTHWEELGRYSPSRICVVMFLLGRLSNPPDRCTGAQENTGHDIRSEERRVGKECGYRRARAVEV